MKRCPLKEMCQRQCGKARVLGACYLRGTFASWCMKESRSWPYVLLGWVCALRLMKLSDALGRIGSS